MSSPNTLFSVTWKPTCGRHIEQFNQLLTTSGFFSPKYSVIESKHLTWYKDEPGIKPQLVCTSTAKDLIVNTSKFTLYDLVGHGNYQKLLRVKTQVDAIFSL